MARKPRLHVPGGVYHVILRGNARQNIFFDDEDRSAFYRLLDEGARRFELRVHAFCLMSNHVHLAVQVGAIGLPQPLQNLAFRYAQHVNRGRGRVGHLFQGRYKALLVDSDSYLLELVRYIHLNPVRAGLVPGPADYAHSGHAGYIGCSRFSFLTTDWVLAQFGGHESVARERYAAFIAHGIAESHRPDFHVGPVESRVIGADCFVERALHAAGMQARARPAPSLDAIVQQICADSGLADDELSRPGKARDAVCVRAKVAWLASRLGSATLADVGRRFGRDPSGLGRLVAALDREAKQSNARGQNLRRLLRLLSQA
jgi:putative transposase